MDYTKIYKVVKKHKNIRICTKHGQWLICSASVYNIDGLPEVSPTNLLPMIGADDSATYNVSYKNLPVIDEIMVQSRPGDGCLINSKIIFKGLVMLRGEGSNAPGCVFAPSEDIKAFGDRDINYIWRTYQDENGERSIIIVRSGLITVGAVLPAEITDVNGWSELSQDLTRITAKIDNALLALKNKKKNPEQLSFDDLDSPPPKK